MPVRCIFTVLFDLLLQTFLSSLPSRSETYLLLFSVVVGGGGVNFYRVSVFRTFFSETIMAKAMKLGSCIHLDEYSL